MYYWACVFYDLVGMVELYVVLLGDYCGDYEGASVYSFYAVD